MMYRSLSLLATQVFPNFSKKGLDYMFWAQSSFEERSNTVRFAKLTGILQTFLQY